MAKHKKTFEDLSFDDLKHWAGDKIVARGQTYKKQVADLRRTGDGALLAWVKGASRYATKVWHDGDRLDSACTCPYWDTCKHAVAVVLVYLDAVRAKTAILTTNDTDSRLLLIESAAGADNDDDDACLDVGLDDDDDDSDEPPPRSASVSGKKKDAGDVREILGKMSKDELVNFAASLAAGDQNIARTLIEDRELAGGKVNKIVKALRADIEDLTSRPAWKSHWSGEGEMPDYSGVLKRMNLLLKAGHSDALLTIGNDLLDLGTRQIEQSDDEGETAEQIGKCLELVFKAIPSSSLEPPEQILWLINAFLCNDYGQLDNIANPFPRRRYSKADWSSVADEILARLAAMPVEGTKDFDISYKRKHLMGWVITALEESGRTREIIPLLEQEAPITFCYAKLVDALIKARRIDEARQRAYDGFLKTKSHYAGIAWELENKLRELAVREKNRLLTASFRAYEFLERPSLEAYKNLEKAAKTARVWQPVRQYVLEYLETGKRPDAAPAQKPAGKTFAQGSGVTAAQWPLPSTGLPLPETESRGRFPDTTSLIGIALYEKRNTDAVTLYENTTKGHVLFDIRAQHVAEAVQKTHPEAALKIWRSMTEAHIAQVKPASYAAAAGCLRKMKKVHEELGSLAAWHAYIAELRVQHKPKRRLLEVLASLEGKRIIDM